HRPRPAVRLLLRAPEPLASRDGPRTPPVARRRARLRRLDRQRQRAVAAPAFPGPRIRARRPVLDGPTGESPGLLRTPGAPGHAMKRPPFTSRATPLMYDASSEARKAIAAACSS